MGLFKYRLKQVGKTLLNYIMCIAAIALFMWVATFIPQTVVYWVGGTFISLFALLMVWAFLYWLFIEPFKKERK